MAKSTSGYVQAIRRNSEIDTARDSGAKRMREGTHDQIIKMKLKLIQLETRLTELEARVAALEAL